MPRIGVVLIESENTSDLSEVLQHTASSFIEVQTKNELALLNCLVLSIDKSEQFVQACEWLIAVKNHPQVFVWLYAPHCSEKERDVYFQLGANSVIDRKDGVGELGYQIKNLFIRFTSKKQLNEAVRETESLTLKESNRSVILKDGKEITLTRLEYKLVSFLYNSANTAISYKKIAKELWGEIECEVPKYRVANIVFHLREKLGSSGDQIIRTVRSKGYLLDLE